MFYRLEKLDEENNWVGLFRVEHVISRELESRIDFALHYINEKLGVLWSWKKYTHSYFTENGYSMFKEDLERLVKLYDEEIKTRLLVIHENSFKIIESDPHQVILLDGREDY